MATVNAITEENSEYPITPAGTYPGSTLVAFTNERNDGSLLTNKDDEPLIRASFFLTHPGDGETYTEAMFINMPKDPTQRIGKESEVKLQNLGIPLETVRAGGWDPVDMFPQLAEYTFAVEVRAGKTRSRVHSAKLEG